MTRAAAGAFLVEPAEPLVFGPPRSHSAGEAHRVRSQFPPPPLAFQGLVRSRLLLGAEPPLDLDAPGAAAVIEGLVGTPSTLPAGWQIRGPFPATRLPPDADDMDQGPVLQPWVPTPRFILRRDKPDRRPLHAREVVSTHPALSDLPGLADPAADPPVLGRPEHGSCPPLGGWIGPANLRFALGGEEDGGRWIAAQWGEAKPPFVSDEVQPGLAIDRTTSTGQHGLLYFAKSLRFAPDSGLFGRLDAASLAAGLTVRALADGAGQAGRKSRLVRFAPVERVDPDWDAIVRGAHLPETVADGQRFWLVALTPVRLGDSLQPSLRAPLPPGVRVDIRAALTGRVLALGGFEMASGRPRPNRLYVPGGSAWLLQVTGGTPETRREALSTLHDRHPLGEANEAAMGFGHTLVGLGPLTTEDAP